MHRAITARAIALAALLASVTSLAGCVVGPLDLEGRECPCTTGWVCDEPRNLCVREGDEGDAGQDAGAAVDAGPRLDAGGDDAGALDGAPGDGGPPDSGPPDSGPPDSGPRDAGPPPPPTGCGAEHAGRLFCDGFDTPGFGAWDEMQAPDGSRLERVTDVVYRGTGALRAEGAMGSVGAKVIADVFATPPPPDQWLRAYYFVPAGGALGFEIHELIASDDSYNAISYVSSGSQDLHAHGWLGDMRDSADSGFPRGSWVCIETHVHFDATAGVYELFRDDSLVVAITGVDTTAPMGLTRIAMGVVWKDDADPARVVYVDEVVADTARIGCD